MSNYSEFFLNSNSSVVQLELLELSHSNFSKIYRIVRNSIQDITVTLEDFSTQTFTYYPLKIESIGNKNDLDTGFQISLGDLGEVLPSELDSVISNNGFEEKPIVKYRTYRSDDLSAPMLGPLILEVQSFSFNKEGATFIAKAPSLNVNSTGELYKISRFPTLKGFL